jgi:hypothetical protein
LEQCYLTSLFAAQPDAGAISEAVITYVRVGQTTSIGLDAQEALFSACQQFALSRSAPYYGFDSTFTRCWLPGVVNPNPTSPPALALNYLPDFVYGTDIENSNANLFYVALTSSI